MVLNWLFGDRSKREDNVELGNGESDLFENFVEVRSHDFFGECSRSPNKRYTLTWRDADDSGTQGGARSSGLGRHLLLEDGKVIADGRVARPHDGKVADNGIFILNDWEFTSDLSGVFSAFRCDGTKILSRRFNANLYNIRLLLGEYLLVLLPRCLD